MYVSFSLQPSSFCCACQPGTHGKPGTPGTPGRDGRDGRDGNQGPVGMTGPIEPPGLQGTKGETGAQGSSEASGLLSFKNWKECAWKNLNDDKNNGLIKVNDFCRKKKLCFFKRSRTNQMKSDSTKELFHILAKQKMGREQKARRSGVGVGKEGNGFIFGPDNNTAFSSSLNGSLKRTKNLFKYSENCMRLHS